MDANNLPSEDVVAKTLQETAGAIGVATRPKVVDFAARQKEQRKANTRRIAARVAVACAALAAVVALIWLLFFSPVLRLEPNNISASGANEWVSNEQIMAIAKRQAGKSLLLVSDGAVEQQLSQILASRRQPPKRNSPTACMSRSPRNGRPPCSRSLREAR